MLIQPFALHLSKLSFEPPKWPSTRIIGYESAAHLLQTASKAAKVGLEVKVKLRRVVVEDQSWSTTVSLKESVRKQRFHTLPLSVVAANSLTSASAWDCRIPIVIFHASIYQIGELLARVVWWCCLRTDFWNFCKNSCAATFWSLWPSRIVAMAAKTGANSCDISPFVAMPAVLVVGEEGQRWEDLSRTKACKMLFGCQSLQDQI